MEAQEQLYQQYYPSEYYQSECYHQGEKSNQLSLMYDKPYSDSGYQNQSGYISIDKSRIIPISIDSLKRSRSKSYIQLSDTEATPLLTRNSNFLNKLSTKRREIWLSLYVIFYVGFLSFASLTFIIVERGGEAKQQEHFREARKGFLDKYPSVLDDDLESLIEDILKVNGNGVSVLRNATGDMNWSFGQALFFSTTVITTIGYGHVTPLTEAGKIFCIIYATIGIPLTLVLISAVVERLLVPANWILGKLNSKLGHLYQPFSIRLLHLGIIATIFAVIFFALPTITFAYLEPNWSALDAFYYCFISLTTIGLGDLIPGDGVEQPNRSLYKIFTTVYLLLGIIGMMLTLTIFYEIPQLNLGQLFTEHSLDDAEKLRLSQNNAPFYSGPSGLYIPQRDDEVRRSVVRIRPHGDSPSPDDPTPCIARVP